MCNKMNSESRLKAAIRTTLAVGSLVALLADPKAVHADGLSEDPLNPAAWTGSLQARNVDARAHTYYFKLPTRLPISLTSERVVDLRLLVRGTGEARAVVARSAVGVPRYLMVVVEGTSASSWTEARATAPTPSVSPVLAVQITPGIAEWSVMVDDQMQARSPVVRHPTPGDLLVIPPPPVPASGGFPPVPGGGSASPWPSTGLREGIPPGYAPIYYQLDWRGGVMTVESTITTAFNGTVTFEVMSPTAPPEAAYAIWAPSHTYVSPDGQRHTSGLYSDMRDIPAGRYLVRVTRESASASASYTLRVR